MDGSISVARSHITRELSSSTTGHLSRLSLKTNKSGSQSQQQQQQQQLHPQHLMQQTRPDHFKSKASEIQNIRILLCVSLMVLAAVLGICVFFFFQAPEQTLAIEQFESIAGRAMSYAQQTTQLKRLGVITMATMIGIAHPDAETWPFVLVDGYDDIATNLVQTISGDGIGFAPIVTPKQLSDFEAFAYDSYSDALEYPNTTAVKDFGRGVWATDNAGVFNIEEPDQKYHEGTIHPYGNTTYGSTYQIYAPVLQHSDGANAVPLMMNLHNERRRGQTIDSILTCSSSNNNNYYGVDECGQMTDMLMLMQREKPASLIMQPIFPANNKSSGMATGIVSSPLVWQDVLDNAFGKEVNGIHCVLSSSTGITFTYLVMRGMVKLVGEGDAHETKFDGEEQMVVLTDKESGLYSESSFSFTLKLYPTEEFMATYRTDNPLWGTIIVVFIMTFLTIVFCLYDWYVRGEFTFKNELLEAKRNFIRFVSHEVRTPLNAVCMGLMLMREELEKSMKEDNSKQDKTNSANGNSANGKQKQQVLSPVGSNDGLSEWKGITDEILENSQNAVDVLNDLLNYDKITSGSLKLELSFLEVGILMNHAQKEFNLPATKKKINVVYEDNTASSSSTTTSSIITPAVRIVGDGVRLIQVLRNLMSNALKFTPPNGKVTVTLSWVRELPDASNKNQKSSKKGKNGKKQQLHKQHRKPGKEQEFTLKKGAKVSFLPSGFLELSVTDTGAGMSEDQMANVFDQGTQFNVNELQCGQGSGLGLYIAKGIMDQHHGSLAVSSEGLGKGTTFTMTVPVYRDTRSSDDDDDDHDSEEVDYESQPFHFKASKAIGQTQQNQKHQQYNLPNLRILVVDDSDTNRKFLSRILHNHGHTCDQARDGSIAVEMVSESMKKNINNGGGDDTFHDESSLSKHHQHYYDAVLLDYEMPIMNGPTAAKKMRELGSDAFIVGITGNLLPQDIEYFRDQGANEVLPKPFNISDLEEILMEYGVGYRGKE